MRMRGTGMALSIGALALLAGCVASPVTEPAPGRPGSGSDPAAGVQPSGDVTEVATGLDVPWSIAVLPDGGALISERDTALIRHVRADGSVETAAEVPDVVPGGEGGLLGLALLDEEAEPGAATSTTDPDWLYAYLTAAEENRIVRMPISGTVDGEPRIDTGSVEIVLDGLDKASNHNGGRIAFGPDGMLYATTGDAGQPDRSQDPESLSGKILRITPEGEPAADNPDPASEVYSLGHRNPQGIAWDAVGQLWAAEFGQSTWDEFNRIEPGANYGWPVVEGIVDDDRFVSPVLQWPTDQSSPSGLTHVEGTFFLAALRGERVWAIYPDEEDELGAAFPVAWFEGEFGRIRDAAPAPDGGLWFLTNNTGGRGEVAEGDDRLLHVDLSRLREG